ncbi:hypothetical protein LTR36_006112 [Oleoguttula mirabilis]|uniref:Myb-like domain-containing protein n=1 Tax=Oleoguttula mirabilis TaxID=1507867 RepID=A0AAV9JCU2_9PEZI|nr:hypothetical protein LTR36_006112 [Oleoguttula mirabilis]
MSSSQVYPTLSGTIDPQQMCGDVTAGMVSSEWYAPTSVRQQRIGPIDSRAQQSHYPMSTSTHTYGVQYAYNDPYVTPYPSSTVESQPWSSYARASVPDLSMPTYNIQTQHLHHHQQLPPHFKDPSRPRSSPSTFGPSVDSVAWPASSGLGIQYTSTAGQPTPVTSTFPPNIFQTYPIEEQYGMGSSPELRQPQPRRPYTTIAPNPAGIPAGKRQRDDDDRADSSTSTKRRKRTSSVASADLSEDDRFLVRLKEDESLPWKDIATRFHTDKGKNFQVAALQMRYKRLREKFRVWQEEDVNALNLAHEYWEKYKWEIISAKMLDFGLQERWPARHCARKWQDLENQAAMQATTAGLTPGISQFSSPVDGPVHFAFMPIQ